MILVYYEYNHVFASKNIYEDKFGKFNEYGLYALAQKCKTSIEVKSQQIPLAI